jgi:hypothetical protein
MRASTRCPMLPAPVGAAARKSLALASDIGAPNAGVAP